MFHTQGAQKAYKSIPRDVLRIMGEERTAPVVFHGDTGPVFIQWMSVLDMRRVLLRAESVAELISAGERYVVQRLVGEAYALLCADITLESICAPE